jgi:hypothetical protein
MLAELSTTPNGTRTTPKQSPCLDRQAHRIILSARYDGVHAFAVFSNCQRPYRSVREATFTPLECRLASGGADSI